MKTFNQIIAVSTCLMGVIACSGNDVVTPNAYSEVCSGVTALSWQKSSQGTDAETVLQIATKLAAAAEADADQIKKLGSASADIKLESELAKVMKENVQNSSDVESGFWEQNINFTQAACWAVTLLERNDLTEAQRDRALATVDKIINSRIDFKNEVQIKKNQI